MFPSAMIEPMLSSSQYPGHVFIGYLLRAGPKDGELTHTLFYEKETSFSKATKTVEAKLANRRVRGRAWWRSTCRGRPTISSRRTT